MTYWDGGMRMSANNAKQQLRRRVAPPGLRQPNVVDAGDSLAALLLNESTAVATQAKQRLGYRNADSCKSSDRNLKLSSASR